MIFRQEIVQNTGLHIEKIISEFPCSRHGSSVTEACWEIHSIHGPLRAICDRRAREAGATGKITPYKKSYASNSKKD